MATPEEPPALGLTNARGLGLGRVPVRVRELASTLGAWKLSLASEEGEGAVTLVEREPGGSLYRGDGVCLGWSQERLAAAYTALAPRDEDPALELPQLG